VASFTDHTTPYPAREAPEAKRSFLARWFRPAATSAINGTNGIAHATTATSEMRHALESARSRFEPPPDSPRTSWEDQLRQRRETAEREFRMRLQEEQERTRARLSQAAAGDMSPEQAREILSVGPGATDNEIRAAYETMMNCKHPDVRGSEFLTKLAATARDTLLRPASLNS
jgi:DNA-directed RNA polymerase specialized sigma24 family protein